MHAVATSPDDLFSWTAARDATKRPERVTKKRKNVLPFLGLVQGKTLPRFIRKNSPNPNEFAQFAFNVLMLPMAMPRRPGHPEL